MSIGGITPAQLRECTRREVAHLWALTAARVRAT